MRRIERKKGEIIMAREFIVPGQIISGAGALDMAQGALAQFGKKALIVTDKVMIELGNCEKVYVIHTHTHKYKNNYKFVI